MCIQGAPRNYEEAQAVATARAHVAAGDTYGEREIDRAAYVRELAVLSANIKGGIKGSIKGSIKGGTKGGTK